MSFRKNTTERNKLVFLKELEKAMGVVTTACKESGIGRTQYYTWLKEDPDFAKSVEEVPELQMDFVESQLLKKIKDGSDQAIIFYLKTKGKKRGYTDKLEIEGKLTHDIQVIKLIGPNGNTDRTHEGI